MAKKLLKGVRWLLLLVALFGVLANGWIWSAGWGRFHREPADAPAGCVVVLLGTNEFLADQRTPSVTYRSRIEATARLCAGGKVRLVVTSGTPDQAVYMARHLVEAGVRAPIVEDPYGWRTLDSAVRAQAAFPGAHVVFVSQGWHDVRALWIADRLGLPATAYAADFGSGWRAWWSAGRDVLAKPKAVLDWLAGQPLATGIPPAEGNVPHR
jgi:SanA protein